MTDQGRALLPVSLGQSYVGRVIRRFGAGYATIEIDHDGTLVEVPVRLGGVLLHDDYAPIWRMQMERWVQEGDLIAYTVLATGADLDLIEILDAEGMPLSLYAVTQGWAVPDAAVGADSPTIRHLMIQAVREARLHERGIWGDGGEHVDGGILTKALLAETVPLRSTTLPVIETGGVMVVVLILGWCALTAWVREQAQDTGPGVTRRMMRASLWHWLPQLRRPLVQAQAPQDSEETETHAAAEASVAAPAQEEEA